MSTATEIRDLDRADLLPGHQDGRQALIDKLHGLAHVPVVVAGHFDNDTFVVVKFAVIQTDEDGGYWYGDEDVWGAEDTEAEARACAVREMQLDYPEAVVA